MSLGVKDYKKNGQSSGDPSQGMSSSIGPNIVELDFFQGCVVSQLLSSVENRISPVDLDSSHEIDVTVNRGMGGADGMGGIFVDGPANPDEHLPNWTLPASQLAAGKW